MKTIYVWIFGLLYGLLWFFMDYYGFVWILVCSISRVLLGIHHNLRFVESWVGKTLVCIR